MTKGKKMRPCKI